MIICPICDTPVKDTTDQKPVENDHANNYYCPNYIIIHHPTQQDPVGKRICHFSRRQLKYLIDGATAYNYQAIVPPFQITWITGHKVSVWELDSNGERVQAVGGHKRVYESKNKTDYKEFLKTVQRFKVLVPFS
jgi:hypothetical protein